MGGVILFSFSFYSSLIFIGVAYFCTADLYLHVCMSATPRLARHVRCSEFLHCPFTFFFNPPLSTPANTAPKVAPATGPQM